MLKPEVNLTTVNQAFPIWNTIIKLKIKPITHQQQTSLIANFYFINEIQVRKTLQNSSPTQLINCELSFEKLIAAFNLLLVVAAEVERSLAKAVERVLKPARSRSLQLELAAELTSLVLVSCRSYHQSFRMFLAERGPCQAGVVELTSWSWKKLLWCTCWYRRKILT